MTSQYKYFQKKDTRQFKPKIILPILAILVLMGVMGAVIVDLSKNPNVVDESNNQVVLGEFVSTLDEYKTIDTKYFKVDIPKDWKHVNAPEIIIEGKRYYPQRFQGVSGNNIGRKLDVYMDKIPKMPVERVLKVLSDGGQTPSIGSVSSNCSEFTKPKDQSFSPVETKWEDISFTCSMSESQNNIASVASSQQSGVVLKGKKEGPHTYLFIYTDHGSMMNNDIFPKIMHTFIAK